MQLDLPPGSRRVSHASHLHLRTQNMQRINFRCIDAGNCDRYVAAQRHGMSDVKQKVALSSIAASAGLTAAKAIVGVMSGSLALLSAAEIGRASCKGRVQGWVRRAADM